MAGFRGLVAVLTDPIMVDPVGLLLFRRRNRIPAVGLRTFS